MNTEFANAQLPAHLWKFSCITLSMLQVNIYNTYSNGTQFFTRENENQHYN